jgi:hypothetical protein
MRSPQVEHALVGQRVAISAERWDTAAALGDAILEASGESVWVRSGMGSLESMTAGVWDGGQLSDVELNCLTTFCSTLASQQAPVIVVLDFPRHDRCSAALLAGAAAVLGKPWLNADLVATLRSAISPAGIAIEAA